MYIEITETKNCTRLLAYGNQEEGHISPIGECIISKDGKIHGLKVIPSLRNRGIGTNIIQRAVSYLHYKRLTPYLFCFEDKIPFYEYVGFKKVRELLGVKPMYLMRYEV